MSILKCVTKGFIYLFIVAILLSATKGFGQDGQGASIPEKPKTMSVSGTVNYVDAISGTITIYGEMGIMVISVPDGTKIMHRAEKLHLDDIHPEDSVSVQYYSPKPGKNIAVSIMDSTTN